MKTGFKNRFFFIAVRPGNGIGVIEMKEALDVPHIQAQLLAQGVWLRPFGKLLYTMPAFVMQDEDVQQLTSSMVDVLQQNSVN